MKATIALTAIAALAAKASAACWSERLGYSCCRTTTEVYYTDADGEWGVENNQWCGIQKESCWAERLGYSCCKYTSEVAYVDGDGNWGVENNNWCGIIGTPTQSQTPQRPTNSNNNNNIDDSNPVIGNQYSHNGKNPFAGHKFFINPYYTAEVDNAIAQMSDSSLIKKAEKMKEYSNAIWLDNIENMNNWLLRNLKTALAEQNAGSQTVLTVFVVYDLPGRDCHALASNGELLANDADFERYKTEYIDVIEGHLKTYKSQPVVLVIEPDSLANMVTNLNNTPACRDSEKYYMDGHAYLIKKFGILPHVAMYLDIGHAFWLGWDDNRLGAAKVYSKVIQSGAPGEVRGFASNVANYTPWEDPELSRGPDTEWNSCPDEKRYIEAMYKDFKSAGIKSVYFIDDSSRNGVKNDRFHPGEWCNQTGSGIGARPQANPVSGMDYLDAFYWVKPYGESDGTSDESAKRYDGYCGHRTAMKPAPEAGQWFQAFFEEGLKNANPPL
ncbi:glycoside hydrolase family 6 protein [Piromyces sp. E2]|nr:glycoside hydrolase family 6 protein [Piromyces sp. E2]|eukprot:OUM61927.1 glycoside hydrolase family 6 protein [Piromyces sp. E2]